MRPLFLLLIAVSMLLPTAAEAQQPWFFAVLSDPQFGMYAKDQNFVQETANFEFAIANLNRLHPRFVVICGDLVNRTGDAAEIAEYKRILHELDPSIPVYSVAGNHDVGNIPTPATIAGFRAAIGPDYYTFSQNGIFGIVLDSNLIRAPQGDPAATSEQEKWLEQTLARAKSDPQHPQIMIFQHIPYFVKSTDEADQYFNIPKATRVKYLSMFKDAGVQYIFAGHTHKSAVEPDGNLNEIITGAVGMPLGGTLSGFRIVTVTGQELDSRWFCFGGIPNKIDPRKPLATLRPQCDQ